jgi:TRAP-type C4-dicarboxylate transport system permease small subunit
VAARALAPLVVGAEWLAVSLLLAMVVTVALGVFYRYALDSALVWYDEFASYLLVWLTFVGSVPASWRGRQISFELLVERAPPRASQALCVLAELGVLVFHVLIAVYGWNLMERMGDETAVSLLWVKMSWVYAVLPVTAVLMALISLQRLFVLLSGVATESGHSRGE